MAVMTAPPLTGQSGRHKLSFTPHPLLDASPVFRMARQQLQAVADKAHMDPGVLERLSMPKRSMIVSVPVRMDDGSTRAFQGYRVQHSITSGPAKGGLRYNPSVDLGEVAALAMWMSWKCGLMNLPYGGGKGGIACDPVKLSKGELERMTRRFTEEVMPIIGPRTDVMAPDMGTDEQTMSWIMDTYSMHIGHACPEVVTGKPIELGGCLGRREATGRGVTYTIMEALKELSIDPRSATAVVQGFGNVGSVTCLELFQRGVKIIAIGDRWGSIHNPEGIDVPSAMAHVTSGKQLPEFKGARRIPSSELLTIPCTVLVPAAMERVINEENVERIHCKILAEGANGPTTPEADEILEEKGVFIIPDILCNAGGVTTSYFEWVQDLQQFFWDEEQVKQRLEKLMVDAFRRVRRLAKDHGFKNNRIAALTLGIEKIAREKELRGLYP